MFAAEIDFDKTITKFLSRARNMGVAHNALLRGVSIIVTEAREVLVQNEHIITGTLLRSIQSESVKPLVVRIGSPLGYAYFVEILPDGGFIRPAVRTRLEEVAEFIGRELMGV